MSDHHPGLDRDSFIDGLNDLIERVHAAGIGPHKSVDWRPLYDRDGIRVEVAPADALLAMKLRAPMSRPARDTADIASLVAELDIESADDAESTFTADYPGAGLNDWVYALVERAVAHRAEFQTTCSRT